MTYVKPDATIMTRNVSTDNNGYFKDVYKPDKTGLWNVKVQWDGDTDHQAAVSSPASFTVNKLSSTISMSAARFLSVWGEV